MNGIKTIQEGQLNRQDFDGTNSNQNSETNLFFDNNNLTVTPRQIRTFIFDLVEIRTSNETDSNNNNNNNL